MSEAYSEEPVDADQVKKLIEFGDDYRNYIDSQSDCASSFTRRSHSFGHSTLLVSMLKSCSAEFVVSVFFFGKEFLMSANFFTGRRREFSG